MIDLAVRDLEVRELMDDPDCDLQKLRRTYAQFRLMNRLVAGWHGLYRRHLRPRLRHARPTTLLDIGCGGGDLARALVGWAERDGLELRVTGIDPDPRAYAFATTGPPRSEVEFYACTSADLVAHGQRYDIVTSNHLLHHLDEEGLAGLLHDSARLASGLVLHSDIARSRLAYRAYGWLSRPFGSRSFLRIDGLRSIRRSYTAPELRAAVPAPWRVESQLPARLLLLLEPGTGQAP